MVRAAAERRNPMTIRDVLLPLFVEVILTFVLLFWMAFLRTRAITGGAVSTRDIALREPKWPADATQVANAFHNQLELPMLFYVLTILAWDTHHAGTVFVALAWLFVVLRLIQVIIHVTDNHGKLSITTGISCPIWAPGYRQG
jgi:hypothetical protein